MLKTINIEIISDFACPWCLIGKRRLIKTVEQCPDLDITFNWRPFQLNPNMPREGCNRRDYYRDKFGDAGAKNLRETLKIAGAEEGVLFCDEPNAIAPNTLSAHVLMFWAIEDESINANALAEKLLYTHHIACKNIGDHHVLTRIAGEVGMDEIDVMEKLATGDDEEKVKEQIHQSAARGVFSVPCFIINNQYNISGVQSVATLVSALNQIANAIE